MRAIITASGIQDYIFDITQRAASARLRGRSARLGLVLDRCRQKIEEELRIPFEVLRSAGSRLEIEFKLETEAQREKARACIDKLQGALDRYSRIELDAQVWFTATIADSKEAIYTDLSKRKLNLGQKVLQMSDPESGEPGWKEEDFSFVRQTDERRLQREERDEARNLAEAFLGRQLARRDNVFVQFTETARPNSAEIRILDRYVQIGKEDPGGYRFTLRSDSNTNDPGLIRKHLCRHAPVGDDYNLLDLNEIAERSTGAHFLGVLKADLDDAGNAFAQCTSEEARTRLSIALDIFFTEELENLLRQKDKSGERPYTDCYVVYSGGDDLFLLGPWDKLIRFAFAFQEQLSATSKQWRVQGLTISAGFKLAHPGSAVRHLATEVEEALDEAKGRGKKPTSIRLPAKNRFAVFERLLAWDEVGQGILWAESFIGAGEKRGKLISRGFLQRLQYHASESRRYFEKGELDALHFIPLLHSDWERNKMSFDQELAEKMQGQVLPLLKNLGRESERMWRIMDFASRFTSYALRGEEKGR
jgi:hypothetical protein